MKKRSKNDTALWRKILYTLRPFLQVKPLSFALIVGVVLYTFVNRQELLEKLDDRPISAFALVGSTKYTQYDDVRDVVLKMGQLKGFFGQDVDVIREQIQSMPWIKGSVVRKIWPNRLSIMIAEYQPVAYWNDEQLVAADGTVFSLPKEKLQGVDLPRLGGPDYQSAIVLNAWERIFKDLQQRGIHLKGISVDERNSWDIVVENEITLKLGRGEWKSKIDHFMTIYPQIEIPENKKISYIDLRYKHGAAVSFTDL